MFAVRDTLRVQGACRLTWGLRATISDACMLLPSWRPRVHPRLSQRDKDELSRKMVRALKDNVDLAPLAFEMRTAAHFMSKGFDVEFTDLCGDARFDFLVRNSHGEMAVECKSVSGDLGHQIHLLRPRPADCMETRSFCDQLREPSPRPSPKKGI